MPGLKGALASLPQDISEAAIKPVVDEVGRALETGIQTVIHGPQATSIDPKVQAQKKADEEKRKTWALRVIDWNQKLAHEQSKVRQAAQQKQTQEEGEKQQGQKVKQFKLDQKKREVPAELKARNTTETRKGVGG